MDIAPIISNVAGSMGAALGLSPGTIQLLIVVLGISEEKGPRRQGEGLRGLRHPGQGEEVTVAAFDYKTFLRGSVNDVFTSMKPAAQMALLSAGNTVNALTDLSNDVDKTFEAIEQEHDPVRLRGLQDDLQGILVARKKSILLKAQTELASDAHAALDAALETFIKIAVTAAKAFLPVKI